MTKPISQERFGVSKTRESSIELLRIIAVIMVITVHYLGDGDNNILSLQANLSGIGFINYLLSRVIESVAIIGVNLFVIISGYFSINSKGINIRRIVNLLIVVAFWGILAYFHGVACGEVSISLLGVTKSLFPYFFETFWYVRVYVILMIFSPFINLLLERLTKQAYLYFVIIYIICFSLLPSFCNAFENKRGYDIISLIMYYVIGGYIRKCLEKRPNRYICLLLFFIFSGLTSLCSVFVDVPYWGYDFILYLLSTIFLFLFFEQIHFTSKVVNYLAKMTFGVYVLNVVFPDLYTKLIIRGDVYYSSRFALHIIVCVLGFWIVATLFEIIRTYIFKYTIDRVFDKIGVLNKRVLTKIEINSEEKVL